MKKIKFLDNLKDLNLPKSEFSLVNSSWLSILDIRQNGDLDVLISSKLRKYLFSNKDINKHHGLKYYYEKRIRFYPANSIYGKMYNAKNLDDAIYNFSIKIDGINFIQPRFYLMYKKIRLQKNYELLKKTFFFSKKYFALSKKIKKELLEFEQIELYLKKTINKNNDNKIFDEMIWDYKNKEWKYK